MKELFKTLRLAFYVCALPLVATAVASAHNWMNSDESSRRALDELSNVLSTSVNAGKPIFEHFSSHPHVLYVDEAGGVSGRLILRGEDASDRFGAKDMRVTLNRRGIVIAEATSDEAGVFRFENVAPNAYTFIASSPEHVATFGVYIYANENNVPSAKENQIDVMTASANVAEVRKVLNGNINSSEVVSYYHRPAETELKVASGPNRVLQKEDGSINGRVVPLQWLEDASSKYDVTGNKVHLFGKSGLVATVPVDADGKYKIEDIEPGFYDFVAFGPHGAAAFSIEIVANEPLTSTSTDADFLNASSKAKSILQEEVDAVMTEPPAQDASQEPTADQAEVPPPPPPPGYGGFYPPPMGSTSGFGGDTQEWTGLIGMALAAWVLVEAIDNRNRFNEGGGVITPPIVVPPVIPPVSPFN